MTAAIDNNVTVNAWELKDLLANMDTLNERLAHLITLASMTNADSDTDQLRAVISAIKDSLHDIKIVTGHDQDRLAELINESLTA